jgi:hypothetical protein
MQRCCVAAEERSDVQSPLPAGTLSHAALLFVFSSSLARHVLLTALFTSMHCRTLWLSCLVLSRGSMDAL